MADETPLIKIDIPYNSQRDNKSFPDFPFSSQCMATSFIMLLSTWIKEAETSKDFETDYVKELTNTYTGVARITRSSHWPLCLKRLNSIGVKGEFKDIYDTTNIPESEIKKALSIGSPVVTSTRLTDFGHIILIIGETNNNWIVHDPWGDGFKGYLSGGSGNSVQYSKSFLRTKVGNGISYFKALNAAAVRYSANSNNTSNIGNIIVEIASKYVGVDATPYSHPNEQTWIFSWSNTGSNASELKNLMVQKSGYNGTGLFCDDFCRTIWVLAYEKAGRAELAAKVRDGFRFWDSNAPKPMTIAYVEEKFKKVLPDINFSDKPTVGAIMCFPGANPLNLAHNALVKSVSSDGKSFESINANDGNWLGKIKVASYTLDQVKGMKFIAPPPAGVGDFTDNNISVTSTQEQIVQFGPAFAKVYQRELFLNKTAFNGIKGAGSGIS